MTNKFREILETTHIIDGNCGTGEYIFVYALKMARENKNFKFENIGKTKLQNIWKRFDKEVKTIELNEQSGNDMAKSREALEMVYWKLAEI